MINLHFFFIYNLKSNFKNKFQAIMNILTIIVSISVVFAIQLINLNSTSYLNQNAKAINGGDISIVPSEGIITNKQNSAIKSLRDKYSFTYESTVIQTSEITDKSKTSVALLRFIDPNKYPLYKVYGDSVDYKTCLMDTDSAIISSNLADRINAKQGDSVQLYNKSTGENASFKISKIVESDGDTTNDMNVIGYVILNQSNKVGFALKDNAANKIYLKLKNYADRTNVIKQLKTVFKYAVIKTDKDVFIEQKKQLDSTKNALSVLGILTMVIAGIGIINTLLLSIIRRQKELSILKVFGLKTYDMTAYLLMESAIKGIIANIFGLPLGFILSRIIDNIVYKNQPFYIYNIAEVAKPAAIVFALSIAICLIFTYIPARICGEIKAISVLRQQQVERKDKFSLVEPVILVTAAVGIVTSLLIKSINGLFYCFILMVAGTLLYMLMFAILKLISKLPKFNNKLLMIALKNLGAQSSQFAIVLVTLVIGLSSAEVAVNIGNSVIPSLKETISKQSGYNLIIFTSMTNQSKVRNLLLNRKDVSDYTQSSRAPVVLNSINGKIEENLFQKQVANPKYNDFLNDMLIEGIRSDKSLFSCKMKNGRWLTKSDNDTNNVVIGSELAESMGIKVNDSIGLILNGQLHNFKVIGIKDKTVINTSEIVVCYDSLKTLTSFNSLVYYINVNSNTKLAAADFNKTLNHTFIVDIDDLLPALKQTINNFILLMIFISLFCIIASMLLMANTTLMTFLQNTKYYLILKIMGAKNRDIRIIILLDSIIIALIGGVISAFITNALTGFVFEAMIKISYTVDYTTLLKLLGLSIVIVVISALFIVPKIKLRKLNLMLRAE